MKALEINVKNINKLAFIYNLNSYCLIHAVPIADDAIKVDMSCLYESDYLYEPIECNPIIEEITKSRFWEQSYIGFNIDSIDTLRATLIQSIDYSSVFFDANINNINFWKSKLSEIVGENNFECNPIRLLFNWNKDLICEENKFQIWFKEDIVSFDDGLSTYKIVVTGVFDVLEYVYSQFVNSEPDDIGKYPLFSNYNDSIKWIEI